MPTKDILSIILYMLYITFIIVYFLTLINQLFYTTPYMNTYYLQYANEKSMK